MNANELADELERLYQQDIIDGVADLSMPESATMLRQQQAEIEKLKDTVDKLLNHCDDPECWECGKIICPYGGEMHFHHDGCPTCAEIEAQEK